MDDRNKNRHMMENFTKKLTGEEVVNEATIGNKKNDFMGRGLNTNIHVKNQPNEDISEKIYYEMIKFMKKHKISPNEIIFKF